MENVLILQLPSPPGKNVFREWAGGMGTALPSPRDGWGHDPGYYEVPYSPYLYIARGLELAGMPYVYRDLQARERLDLEEFDAVLREAAPGVVVTQVNLPSLTHDLQLLARVRAVVPSARIILVGATGKWFADRIFREGLADLIMEEAEELLVAENAALLMKDQTQLLRGGAVAREGRLVHLPAGEAMRSLDFVDFPAYHLLDFARYESDLYFGRRQRYATVYTTKGCPYRCGYCPYPYGFGRRMIYRSPALVGSDIQRLRDEFGVEHILFRDQVFSMNRRHAEAVCQELIRRDLGMLWLCETRYDLVDEALLDLMKQAGCREIHYGLESADEAMFASVAKIDGPKSLDLFERAIGWTQARGMSAHVHLIVGMPDESRQTIRNSALWLRRVKPDSIQASYFVPYPGTPMFDELRTSKALGDVEAIDWEAMGSFTDPVLPTHHLTLGQVRVARQRLVVDWRYTLADRVVNRARRLVGLAPG